MSQGLDVIILDDDSDICDILTEIIKRFYTWGEIISFSDMDKAIEYCKKNNVGVAIFVIDVFLKGTNGFFFLDSISKDVPMAFEDAIIITGNADDDIVNMCIASNVNHLLEKPVKPYALQLAIRSIVTKYVNFAKKLLKDQEFAKNIADI